MTNSSTSPARLAPPVGGFREIGGRRVFVHRAGDGGPAVVVLPGAGMVGLDYFLVQQRVSRFTTAVVYDRGGTGYSDPVPLPRDAATVAAELHELLRGLDIAGPYVLVAHSLGGAYAHRFAQLYPRQLAGLVWLDAFHRDWDDFMPAAAGLAAGERMAPGPERIRQMRQGLRRMYAELLANHPEHLRRPLMDGHVDEHWLRGGFAERGSLVALAAELRAGPDLPDVPLIALTTEVADPVQQALASGQGVSEQTLHEVAEGRRKLVAAVVNAVSHGERRVVPDVGHSRLCFERPDAVVEAVRDVVHRVVRA